MDEIEQAQARLERMKGQAIGPRLILEPEETEAAERSYRRAIGVPESEGEIEYQAKRADVLRAYHRGEIRPGNVTRRHAWYLPADVMSQLAAEPRPLPPVSSFGIPLTAEIKRAIDEDKLGETKAIQEVRDWHVRQTDPSQIEERRRLLLLSGGCGTGKTSAAAWLCRQVGEKARYAKARELCRIYGSRWSDNVKRWQELIDARLLVVDEVGGHHDRRNEAGMLHEVIDARIDDPTLIITNLDLKTLKAGLNERTVDRIRQIANIRSSSGPSLRRG